MINPDVKLDSSLFDEDKLKKVPTRDGYGEGLIIAGEENENVVAL